MPAPLDPSGFFLSVVVITEQGQRVPLWVQNSEAISGQALFRGRTTEHRDLPYVQSVTVELNRGLIGSATIEISAPFDVGIDLLDSELFVIGNGIEVQFGYPRLSRSFPWFRTMSVKPSVAIDPNEGLTATLNGQGGAFASMRADTPRVYQQPYATTLREIAERHGWNILLPDQLAGEDPLYRSREQYSQGRRSDWIFVQGLARLCQCDAFIAPDAERQRQTNLVIRRLSEGLLQASRLTLLLRGNPDFIDFFPIFSLQSDAEGVWLPRGAGRVVTTDVDPRTQQVTEASASQADVAHTGETGPGPGAVNIDGEASQLLPEPEEPEDAGERLVTSPRAPESPQEVVNQHAAEEGHRGGINVTVETIGIPELFPGDVVTLEGAGVFNGHYGIDGITHNVAADGWTMTLRLISNDLNSRAIMERLQQEFQDFNSTEAPRRGPTVAGESSVERHPEVDQ